MTDFIGVLIFFVMVLIVCFVWFILWLYSFIKIALKCDYKGCKKNALPYHIYCKEHAERSEG